MNKKEFEKYLDAFRKAKVLIQKKLNPDYSAVEALRWMNYQEPHSEYLSVVLPKARKQGAFETKIAEDYEIEIEKLRDKICALESKRDSKIRRSRENYIRQEAEAGSALDKKLIAIDSRIDLLHGIASKKSIERRQVALLKRDIALGWKQ